VKKISLWFAVVSLYSAIFAATGFGASTRLYISPGPNGDIPNSSPTITTNLIAGTSTNVANIVTLLSNVAPTNNSTTMQQNYSDTSIHTLGTVYYPVAYGSDATILANATGTFVIQSGSPSDLFTFTLFDYAPSGGAMIQLGQGTASGRSSRTTRSVTFNNAQTTLSQGHYLMLRVQFTGNSNNTTAIVYCNNNNRLSYIDATIRFKVQTNSNTLVAGESISAKVDNAATTIGADGSFMFDATATTLTLTAAGTGSYLITSYTLDGITTPVSNQSTVTVILTNTRNHNFSVTFTTVTYSVTVASGVGISSGGANSLYNKNGDSNAGGTVSWGAGVGAVNVHNNTSSVTGVLSGTTLSPTVTPDANFVINSVDIILNGVHNVQTIPLNRSTPMTFNNFGPITTGNYSIVATFAPTYAIDVTAGAGGTITPGSDRVARYGSYSMTISGATGAAKYRILSISDNGAIVTATGTTQVYSLTNITADHTIVATFQRVYSVTTTVTGGNGSISPSGTNLFDAGSSPTYAITPSTGYQVEDVQVNGTSVGPLSVVPLDNLSSDTTINASFILSSDLNNFVSMPSFVSAQVPPNVMIMLSVESPMAGVGNPNVTCAGTTTALNATCSQVTDSTCSSNGALGCYNDATDYAGYFDDHKCYDYSGSGTTGLFTAGAAATVQASTTYPAHQCTGKWSGNFLNWSTAMALDNFRKAFTGGNRDPSDSTIIVAGRFFPNSWYPTNIKLDNAEHYTPYSGTRYFRRSDVGFGVCNASQTTCNFGSATTSGDVTAPSAVTTSMQAAFTLRIKACDTAFGVENRCNTDYATPLPEGTIQKYATQMRFGLLSYLKDDDKSRDGGVLRSNIKWLNPKIPYGTKYHNWNAGAYEVLTCNTVGGCTNPEAELDATGRFISNPDAAPGTLNSGVINYINKFGYAGGYKSYDPVSEMYYQAVRYFMKLGPSTVNNYCKNEVNPSTTDAANDGFAVFCDTTATPGKFSWRDYNLYPCAQNFLIGVQDANPWLDKRIPGTAFIKAYGGDATLTDYCGSGTQACDTDFKIGTTPVDVKSFTNRAGDNESITGSTMNYSCEVDDTGACTGGFNGGGKNMVVQQLGRVILSSKEDSYNIVGLSYFAHTTNLRPDLDAPDVDGKHTLTTYLIDTQEPSGTMINGPRNALYLAAKYGGFDDKDGDGKPFNSLTITKDAGNKITNVVNACGTASAPVSCAEWDSDGDAYPDTYFFASQSSAVQAGLDKAFKDMLRRMSSGTAASILSNSNGTGASLVQAVFYPKKIFSAQTEVDWIGEMQDFWYYLDPFLSSSTIREDSDADNKLNLKNDKIVHFRFDGSKTWVDLYNDVKGDGSQVNFSTTVTPDNVKSLWKAGNLLWSRDLDLTPRSIYTTLDGANITNFLALTPGTANIQKMFQANSSTEVTNLINFTNGLWDPDPAYRDRRVTIGSTSHVWKLGDIVSSTPKLLSSMPLNSYHLDPPGGYSDASYVAFTADASYTSRGMVFVGANDGMMHAFNLGVLTQTSSKLEKASISSPSDLGKEMWAYIPKNVIPYLRYYADPKYNHIFSVDGPTVLTDVSLEKPTGCLEANYWNCPKAKESWKTVLVGSMGIGGASAMKGASCIDCVRTPIVDPVDNTKGLGYSTYFALDVSTPATPALLWEFSNPLLGFSTSGMAIVRINPTSSGSSKNGRWVGVIASGPTGGIDLTAHQFKGRSNQNLQIFVLDLKTGALLSKDSGGNAGPIDTGIPFAFAGTITSATIDTDRWNKNGGKGWYQDDALYIGYTKRAGDGSNSSPYAWTNGGVLRIVIPENTDPDNINTDNWGVSRVIDDVGAVTTSIAKLQDRKKHALWLYFGTGRFYNGGDDATTTRQIFGVKEQCYKQSAIHTDDTSSAEDISDKDCTVAATTADLQLGLNDLDNKDSADISAVNNGWYINLAPSSSTANAERVVSDPVALTNGMIYFTTFAPTTNICKFGGSSAMWAVTYDTGGTPPASGLIGKALVQTSTGGFQEIDLSDAFTLNYSRKTGLEITGKPPSDPPPILSNSNLKPIKKILHIMER